MVSYPEKPIGILRFDLNNSEVKETEGFKISKQVTNGRLELAVAKSSDFYQKRY